MNISFWLDNTEYKLMIVEKEGNGLEVTLNQKNYNVSVELINSNEILLNINGRIYDAVIHPDVDSYSVSINGKCFKIERRSASLIPGFKGMKGEQKDVKTPMPGRIVKILRKEGDEVKAGQAVLILEAMKMQNEIKSPNNGRITKIGPRPGESVEAGTLLFSVE